MTQPGIHIERILFPTDFSPVSSRALGHALTLTRRFHSRLRVLHVIPRVFPPGDELYGAAPWLVSPGVRPQADEEMRRFLAPAREAGIEPEVEIHEGDSWREIVASANEMGADLVVLGTHGRTGLEHLFVGSVTERLIPRLGCPVLTVGHAEGSTSEPPGLPRHILCATDFSRTSTEGLALSLALASDVHGQVTLLNVLETVPERGEPAYYTVPELSVFHADLRRKAEERLFKMAERFSGSAAVIKTRIVAGRAYKEILKLAAAESPDLIVIGAQGHGALEHLLFGSNALHVVRQARCPVLTVRPLQARIALPA